MAEPAAFENENTPSTLTPPPQRRFAAGAHFLSAIRLESMSGRVKKACAAMMILAGSLALGGCKSIYPATPGTISPQGDRYLPPITLSMTIWNATQGGYFFNKAVSENGEIRGIKSTDYHAGDKINEFVFPVPKGAKEVGFSRDHEKAALTYVTDKRYLENWQCDVHVDKPCHAEMTNMYYQDRDTWPKTPEKKETITGTISPIPTPEKEIVAQGDRHEPPITKVWALMYAAEGGPFLNEAVYENGEIRGIRSTDYHAGNKISELLFPIPKGAKKVEFSRDHEKAELIYFTDKKYRENWRCDVYVDKPCHAEMTDMYYDEKGTWKEMPEKKGPISGAISGK
jgi:hypothetical protein